MRARTCPMIQPTASPTTEPPTRAPVKVARPVLGLNAPPVAAVIAMA
jgi:hypothetical protein